jgi:hypothetical protein
VTETEGRRRLSRRHLIAAGLMGGALAAAILGRLRACPGCDYEIVGIPLFAAGSAYYLVLALLALFGQALRTVGWVALPGVFVQAGLVRFLMTIGAPCSTCLVSAGCLLLLVVVCFRPNRREMAAALFVVIAGIVSLPVWSAALVETDYINGLPGFARASDFRRTHESETLLVAYVREGCPYCSAFERDYQAKLSQEFGRALVIHKVDAKDRGKIGRLPTFLIQYTRGHFALVRGLPRYEDLADFIRSGP